jgi:hypothetical protein
MHLLQININSTSENVKVINIMAVYENIFCLRFKCDVADDDLRKKSKTIAVCVCTLRS